MTTGLPIDLAQFAPGPPRPAANRAVPPRTAGRAKLWELHSSVHCSIVGTCLTTAELRKIMTRIAGCDVAGFSDHELHADAVKLCSQHNGLSKMLQKALDQRHALAVKHLAKVALEAELLGKWNDALRTGDIAGTYWAVLTHPAAGKACVAKVFGDVHMLSHLVGAANRADIRRLAAIEEENATLRDTVERQQLQIHKAVSARDDTIRALRSLACQKSGTAADPADGGRTEAALHALVRDLQDRLSREAGRNERLQQKLGQLRAAKERLVAVSRAALRQVAALQREVFAAESHASAGQSGGERASFAGRVVLYVGGRPHCVDQLRAVVAEAGGTLLAHDGGQQESASLLPGLIGQADQVVFPVDCVSHDAALAVKRLCRELGRPWVPLRSSGSSSFLAHFAGARCDG